MNEEKLIEIWKKTEEVSFAKADFEAVKRQAEKARKKLRRKIKWDIGLTVAAYILFIPIFINTPQILWILPFIVAVWFWYLWEMFRIYRLETDFQKFENLSEFLRTKLKYLEGYVKRTRWIGNLGSAFLIMYTLYIFSPSNEEFIAAVPALLIFALILQLLQSTCFEIYLRYLYIPPLDETKNLLRQLDDETQ